MAAANQDPRGLRVYDLARQSARRTADLANRARCSSSLKEQLVRASESVVLNIAEGGGCLTPRQKINAFRIAHGSTRECAAALELMHSQDRRADIQRARSELDLIARMLSRLIEKMSREADRP
jgi:four helix bundle protein